MKGLRISFKSLEMNEYLHDIAFTFKSDERCLLLQNNDKIPFWLRLEWDFLIEKIVSYRYGIL